MKSTKSLEGIPRENERGDRELNGMTKANWSAARSLDITGQEVETDFGLVVPVVGMRSKRFAELMYIPLTDEAIHVVDSTFPCSPHAVSVLAWLRRRAFTGSDVGIR